MGGAISLRSIWDKYYAESHGLIYVIDSADKEKMTDSIKTLHRILATSALELRNVPLLVFANKQDLGSSLDINSIAQKLSIPVWRLPPSANSPAGNSNSNNPSVKKDFSDTEKPPSLVFASPSASSRPSRQEDKELDQKAETPPSVAPSSESFDEIFDREICVQAVCALTGKGISEGFGWLVSVLKTKARPIETKY